MREANPGAFHLAAARFATLGGTDGGGNGTHYTIQLSSTHTLAGAEKEWVKLTRIFPELLDGMDLKVQEANVDALGTRYRVRTGLFFDQDHADALCRKFQSLDQPCLVIKR